MFFLFSFAQNAQQENYTPDAAPGCGRLHAHTHHQPQHPCDFASRRLVTTQGAATKPRHGHTGLEAVSGGALGGEVQ